MTFSILRVISIFSVNTTITEIFLAEELDFIVYNKITLSIFV